MKRVACRATARDLSSVVDRRDLALLKAAGVSVLRVPIVRAHGRLPSDVAARRRGTLPRSFDERGRPAEAPVEPHAELGQTQVAFDIGSGARRVVELALALAAHCSRAFTSYSRSA